LAGTPMIRGRCPGSSSTAVPGRARAKKNGSQAVAGRTAAVVIAVFASAEAAVRAAEAAQNRLAHESWPTVDPVRVRMGIHSGEAEERDGDYFGTAVNRAARLMAVGHGGQVLCSATTAELVEGKVGLLDLGEHRLRDLDNPMHLFQVGSHVGWRQANICRGALTQPACSARPRPRRTRRTASTRACR
jgi:hypothetical protein